MRKHFTVKGMGAFPLFRLLHTPLSHYHGDCHPSLNVASSCRWPEARSHIVCFMNTSVLIGWEYHHVPSPGSRTPFSSDEPILILLFCHFAPHYKNLGSEVRERMDGGAGAEVA